VEQCGSLSDGRYQLRVKGDKSHDLGGVALDGDADALPGGDRAVSFHRLYGDANGDATVDLFDLGQFRTTFNAFAGSTAYLAYLDADGNGTVDLIDLGQFRLRFNVFV
jgi:hypothetical protein